LSNKIILVVDDEQRIADTLALILRRNGYETAVAYEGASALAHCSTIQPDLLLTDVVMPGMDGIELAGAVSKKFPECKVLLFSGHAATAELLDRAREQGYDFPLLSKPVHPEVLLKKVADLLNSRELKQVA
jgi:DNA-binding NtrC family response regulator